MNLLAEELMTSMLCICWNSHKTQIFSEFNTNILLNVKFFPILKLCLMEIMARQKTIEIQDSHQHQATLEVMTNVKPGQGAFFLTHDLFSSYTMEMRNMTSPLSFASVSASDLLTNPLIMTLHQLPQYNALLFGDGNVVEAFESFPAEYGVSLNSLKERRG
ncbi:hypothetical protein C8J56DRAFT_890817 [Mycena floridula]|nr:hypothetical protein C8J56DRAFT_890817 [Mycena floridula]